MTLFKFFIINVYNLIRGIYLFSGGLVFLALYYFVIVKLPMGQDMLMQTVEYPWPFIFTNVSVILWMLLSWLSSRQISDLAQFSNVTPGILKHFPRLLGYNVVVGLQLAALNLPTINFKWKTIWLFWALLLFHNLYYFLLHSTFALKTRRLITLSIAAGISYIVFIIFLFGSADFKIVFFNLDNKIAANHYPAHIKIWMFLSILYFILQILFVFLTIQKRRKSENNTESIRWKRIFYGALILSFSLYLIILFSTDFANRFGSLGCLLLAMGLWVAFVCKIKSFAVKYNFRFTMLILLWAVILGCFYAPYDVNLEETNRKHIYAQNRYDIDKYLDCWINDPIRSDALKSQDTASYPVYMVISDGGASKSGYWVASVLSKLEASDSKDKFSDHLLSLAGASGGSVGNLAFYTTLIDKSITVKDTTKVISRYPAANFFEADFLTYPLARFLGPDLIRHLVPYVFQDDRAEALATAMEKSDYNSKIGQFFNRTLDNAFEYEGRFPIVFINTTNIESGSSGVISNVKINPHFTRRLDVLSQLDADTIKGYKNIKLSTAVVLGARFPYLSPAGEINNKYFVDGGYYDNSGGGITSELLQRIETRMKSGKTDDIFYKLRNKLKFKIIYISNGTVKKDEPNTLHPLVNDLAAPLLTVLGTYGNQTELSNRKLQDYIECSSFRLGPESFRQENLPKDTSDTKIPYPMNWVISDYNIKRMEKNLEKVNPKEILGRE